MPSFAFFFFVKADFHTFVSTPSSTYLTAKTMVYAIFKADGGGNRNTNSINKQNS